MRGRFLGAALMFGLAAGCASAQRPVGRTQLPGCPPVWVSTPDDAYAAAFRSRISAVWDPEISKRAFRYHGENSDRYTVLIADIRLDGKLAAVHVEQRSRIGFSRSSGKSPPLSWSPTPSQTTPISRREPSVTRTKLPGSGCSMPSATR